MLKQAIEIDKNFAISYINLSNCFLSQKKYDDALAVLKKSIRIKSECKGLSIRYY